MKFNIKSKDGSDNDVFFDFDTSTDTALSVAQEMVKELQLSNAYI